MGPFLDNALVIGGLIFDEDRSAVCTAAKHSLPNFASDTHLRLFIQGLEENGVDVSLINATFLGNFPQTCSLKRFTPGKKHPDARTINLAFCNVFLFKQLDLKRKIRRQVKRWMKGHKSGTIYIYSLYWPFIEALPRFSHDCYRVVAIIPDIPYLFNAHNRSRFYTFLKKREYTQMRRKLRNFDAFVTLTEPMQKKMNLPLERSFTIEGFAAEEPAFVPGKVQIGEIVYTGKIDKEFGVRQLYEAFRLARFPGKHLSLYGDGNDADYFRTLSQKGENVSVRLLVNKDELRSLQKSAHVLVNPRSSREAFTEFSFPSKTMEYLGSGRPVVMSHLAGIPSAYDKFLNYCDVDDPKAFSEALDTVLSQDPSAVAANGLAAVAFLQKEKTPKILVQSLLAFLATLDEGHL
jgi:glycosyltransferase involved in cell wall biosynthesis